MKEITETMITQYKLNQLGYDFMGYRFNNNRELSFHHLIVAKKDCKKFGLPENGYLWWNGAILKQSSSHDYLHLIQRTDNELFWLITNVLIDENEKGKLTKEDLKKIREFLLYFENKYGKEADDKGKVLIKRQYTQNRIDL